MSNQTLLRDLLADQRLELHLLTTDRALLIAHLQTVMPDLGPRFQAELQKTIDMMQRPNMERIREMLNAPAKQTRQIGSLARAIQGHSRATSCMEVEAPAGAVGATVLSEARSKQLDRALGLIFKP